MRVCESTFIREFKGYGIEVEGVIIGKDKASYKNEIKCIDEVMSNVPSFGGSPVEKFHCVLRNFYESYWITKDIVTKVKYSNKYDCVFVRRPRLLNIAGMLGLKLKIPVVWHLPDAIKSIFGRWYFQSICRIWRITPVANSHYTKSTLGLRDTSVVYPGFSEERLKKKNNKNFRRELEIQDEAPVYGVMSRITKDKAQDVVVKAFLDSVPFQAGAHLVLAGGPTKGRFFNRLEGLASQGQGRVHLIGHVNHVASFYEMLNVAVNGRRNAEPFGISIAEAMASGVPVLAYYLGGPSEMIDDEKNGWLVDAPTKNQYKSGFDKSYGDREKWENMGSSARRSIRDFEVSVQSRKMINLIKKLKP